LLQADKGVGHVEEKSMFVQVIQGHASDAAAIRAAIEKWERDLGPGADGWLGSTAGITGDGRLIAIVRFESEESARRNSDRPEQGAWWAEVSAQFSDEPTFLESSQVVVTPGSGDPDSAGFVQVILGHTSDPERAMEMMSSGSPDWVDYRPDMLGSLAAAHDGGAYTMVLYFTSEAEAREGERKETPESIKTEMAEMEALEVGTPQFLDLTDPILSTPPG
jgi:hypothetical protein